MIVNETKLLIHGGCDNNKDLTDCYILDLNTMKWRRIWKVESGIGTPLAGHSCAIVNQGTKYLNEQIVMFGGWDGKSYSNKTYLFDTSIFIIIVANRIFRSILLQ